MSKTIQWRKLLRSRLWDTWTSGLLLIVTGCADVPAMPQVPIAAPPVSAGEARIWFYRPWEPSESLNLANINVNGNYFGSVQNGGAFYRDVPPGHYHIAPQSYGSDFNQDKDLDVVSGEQAYVKVVSLRAWELGVGGGESNFDRDTFYAWLIPPEVAQAEIARDHAGI